MRNADKTSKWYEDDVSAEEEGDGYPIEQYEITSSPNDFNIRTIYDFIESGAVKIPAFQRNYVWDERRASKLIESLIIGLPVPQIFLYEQKRNEFLVIDGQQRLMSIYYFVKQRFPLKEKRAELRQIFDEKGEIPSEVLHDDNYFKKFTLRLPGRLPDQPNRFQGLNYATLGEDKTAFDLRTIRNVIIRQISPPDDHSSMYEVFNRLNSGGVNLSPQEIRQSLFHSPFYESLAHINSDVRWRNLVGKPDPDLHFKDVEILLRGFALLLTGADYKSSMLKFLNAFSKTSQSYAPDHVQYLEQLMESFLSASASLPPTAFLSKAGRFTVPLFAAVFSAVCADPLASKEFVTGQIVVDSLETLKTDPEFVEAASRSTTHKDNVSKRLTRAKAIIKVAAIA